MKWLIVTIVCLSGCATIPYPQPPNVPYYITNDPNDESKQKFIECEEIGYIPATVELVN